MRSGTIQVNFMSHSLLVPVRIHNTRRRRKPPIDHGQQEHSNTRPKDRSIRFRDPRSKQHAIARGEMKVHFHGPTLYTVPSVIMLGECQQWKETYQRNKHKKRHCDRRRGDGW